MGEAVASPPDSGAPHEIGTEVEASVAELGTFGPTTLATSEGVGALGLSNSSTLTPDVVLW